MLKNLLKRYFIDAMGAMAQGLFASLLIGAILSAVGLIPGLSFFAEVGGFAKAVAGPAMAVARWSSTPALPSAGRPTPRAGQAARSRCSLSQLPPPR